LEGGRREGEVGEVNGGRREKREEGGLGLGVLVLAEGRVG
jgi:hypothetical protein